MLKTVAMAKEYNTVEHLAFQMSGVLKPLLRSLASAELSVHKIAPPIEDLTGGVTVRLTVT
jgi:dihydroneopterin aldolase